MSHLKQTHARASRFIVLLTDNVLIVGKDAITKKTVQVEKMKPDVVIK